MFWDPNGQHPKASKTYLNFDFFTTITFSPLTSTVANCFFAVYLYCTKTAAAVKSRKRTANVIKNPFGDIKVNILGFAPIRSR